MAKRLPHRPNLDHLRRQAKSLLGAIVSGDPAAAATMIAHLPAAKGLSTERVRAAGFRLADAQSAIARQSGFAAWPQLARHVEQLRALEGTWEFASLEIDGSAIPAAALSASRLLIDGDRFRTESPEGTYEGVFNIDVESDPHAIDIEFIAGPEAGNWNYGVFRLDGGSLTLCLDMTGKGRPAGFKTSPGSGCALETLRRASNARPDAVTGGKAGGTRVEAAATSPGTPGCGDPTGAAAPASTLTRDDFALTPSPTLARLQGEWTATKLVRDGQELPKMMLPTGRRSTKGNEFKITFGGQVIIHALMRVEDGADPIPVDYFMLAGAKGAVQHGIMRWDGEEACFCVAAPGLPRPTSFSTGSGLTLSQWRRT